MTNDNLNKYLAEVKSKVNATAKNGAAQRKLLKLKYSFSEQSSSQQLIIWDYIWNNASELWTCIQSFLYLESKMKDKQFLLDSWETIKYWQKGVNNWGLSDALSKIYTKILEIIPDEVLEQLKQWNKSPNLWDRRQSVVSLLYYSRTKKLVLPYDTLIPFINELVDDREYYVQKAVGWSLRELYNVYPSETLRYLEDNIKRVSSTTFAAATEKLKKDDKERLIKIRKLSRQH